MADSQHTAYRYGRFTYQHSEVIFRKCSILSSIKCNVSICNPSTKRFRNFADGACLKCILKYPINQVCVYLLNTRQPRAHIIPD